VTLERSFHGLSRPEADPVTTSAVELVERARPIGPSDRILDIAEGDAAAARVLRERLGAAASIERAGADRAGLPFPDGSFELVLCEDGLLGRPDRASLLREVRRTLAPGGRLIAAVASDAGAALREELIQIGFIEVRVDAATSTDVVSARVNRDDINARGRTWKT